MIEKACHGNVFFSVHCPLVTLGEQETGWDVLLLCKLTLRMKSVSEELLKRVKETSNV